MAKTIYQLLNDVETDFSEYENTELSSVEKEYFKSKILMEVKGMKAEEKKKNRRNWKKAAGVAGMAAAFAIVVGAAGIAVNPVLAKQLFSGVFGTLINNSDDGYIGEKELYTKVGKKAVPIREELEKYKGTGDFVTTGENNGVTLSVSDVYCDGSILYYTLVIRTDNEDINKAEDVCTYLQDAMMWSPDVERNDGSKVPVSGGSQGTAKKAEDGSYVLMEELDLYGDTGSYYDKLQPGVDDNVIVNYTMSGLTGIHLDPSDVDDNGNFKETGRVEGEWKLRFPVTVDVSDYEIIEVNKGDNGIIVEDVIRTETTLIVKVNYSGHATKPPYDYSGCPSVSIKDSEGNYLDGIGGGGGNFTIQDKFLYDGQKDLIVEVSDYISESDTNVSIADIPITLP